MQYMQFHETLLFPSKQQTDRCRSLETWPRGGGDGESRRRPGVAEAARRRQRIGGGPRARLGRGTYVKVKSLGGVTT